MELLLRKAAYLRLIMKGSLLCSAIRSKNSGILLIVSLIERFHFIVNPDFTVGTCCKPGNFVCTPKNCQK